MALLCAWLIGMLCAAFRGVVMWRSCVPMRTQRRAMICSGNFRPSLHQRKPDWVRREIIRLRAYSPDLGCRKLADAFNRQFSAAKRMTVGKSYVAAVLRTNRSEVAYLRRTIKHRVPRPLPRNRLWAMGLSTVTDTTTRQRLVLGLIDHGTRACLQCLISPTNVAWRSSAS